MAADTQRILRVLADAGFEFVVIGGVAALAHGALTPTRDVDVAAALTEDNLGRLMHALAPFRPRHATRPDLGVIRETPAELTKFRLLLIDTDIGRLDVLGEVAPLGGFDTLDSEELEFGDGLRVRVLTLEQLIQVKAHLTRPKDKIVEAELRSIQARRARG